MPANVSVEKNEIRTAKTQLERMRATVRRAVSIGPRFLRGEIDADRMANTMVSAVEDFAAAERETGAAARAHGEEAEVLLEVIRELRACGSGYLAGRCDGACVGRTMRALVDEFGER